jgi:hypothetical protein
MPETTPSPDMHTMSLLIILFLLCLHHASHCAYTLLPNNAISPYINLTFASHESFPQQNIMSSIPQDILDSTVHSLVELAYVRCTSSLSPSPSFPPSTSSPPTSLLGPMARLRRLFQPPTSPTPKPLQPTPSSRHSYSRGARRSKQVHRND